MGIFYYMAPNIMQNVLLQYGYIHAYVILISSNSEIIRVYPGAILKQYVKICIQI